MKKLSLKNLILSFVFLLCFGVVGIFSTTQAMSKTKAYADAGIVSGPEVVWNHAEGNVPYALYTTDANSTTYTNYPSTNSYILLSSNSLEDQDLYLTTIFVRFNRAKTVAQGQNEAMVESASLNVTATLNGKQIIVNKDPSNIQDSFVNYQISLRETVSMYWNDGHLTPIDPLDRVGEYIFTFTYRYTVGTSVSDTEYAVTMSFTVLNKNDYFKDANSFTILNADKNPNKAVVENEQYDNYAYNFNKFNNDGSLSYPTVSYNANIFALNYTYTIGGVSYNYIYENFQSLMNPSDAEASEPGTHTGNVTFKLQGSSTTFSIPTYKVVDTKGTPEPEDDVHYPYNAQVVLTEFGDYKFGIDLLIASAWGYNIIELPELQRSEIKYLTIFGYELTYKDQATGNYLPLANEITHSNLAADNSIDLANRGVDNKDKAIGHVPTLHPITDQSPIRFNYNAKTLTSGKYKQFSTIEEALDEVEATFLADPATHTFKSLAATNFTAGTVLNFVQGSSFNMDGVYLVKLDYSTPSSYGVTFTGSQLFLFEKNAIPPEVLLQTMDDEGNIDSLTSDFTNKNVRILVENKINTFNAPTSIQYYRYENFNETITQNLRFSIKTETSGVPKEYNIDGKIYHLYVSDNTLEYSLSKSQNGRYVCVMTYSPSRLDYEFIFFIDSTPITNIGIYTVQKENQDYYLTTTRVDQVAANNDFGYDISITNQPFSINWAEKRWASYTETGKSTIIKSYSLAINDTDSNIELITADNGSGNDYLLTNGFTTGSISPNVYSNSYGMTDKLGIDQYQSANGVHIFYVEDLAGNYFYRMVMLDNSSPELLQESYNETANDWENSFDPIRNAANFVKTRTRITFGQFKSIEIPETNFTQLNTPVLNGFSFNNFLSQTSYFDSYTFDAGATTRAFLNVPLTIINWTSIDTQTAAESAGTLDPKDHWQITIYPNEGGGNQFFGEKRYTFVATAKNGNTSKPGYFVEMNFDNASGQYWAFGNSKNDNTARYIMTLTGTNLYNLTFKYKDAKPEDENTISMYQIAKISYTYHAFNYDAQSPSYPFSSEPTTSANLTLPELEGEDGYYSITNINQENGKTRPGKYVLTRTYVGGGYSMVDGELSDELGYGQYDSSGNLVSFGNDKFERSYIVYVDHNGIISTNYVGNNVREVGDNISITLGKGTSNQYTFKNFFRSVSEGTAILTTNKLPVQINIPIYKYFIDNGSPVENVMCRQNFNKLEIVLTYKNTKMANSLTQTYRITTYTDAGYFEIPEFSAEGLYTISINDNTGYNDLASGAKNVDPTSYYCSFVIEHTAPRGEVFVNNEPMVESTVQKNTYATNAPKSSSVEFRWEDAVDPYTASVVEINITANDTTETIDFSKYDLNVTDPATMIPENSLFIKNLTITIKNQDIFEGAQYTQHTYVLQLNIDEEIDYTIEIRYAPKDVTDHGYGDFVSTSYRVKIDRTKPNLNIDTLINRDSYLVSAGYYPDIEAVKLNFKDARTLANNTPTIYDYAFSVDASYSLLFDIEDTNPEFYFRGYNKYEDENQSLAPDHPDYSALDLFTNYPRFDIQTNSYGWYQANYQPGVALSTIIKQISGVSKVEGFYEIIERDLAGNYRVFTVFFVDYSTNHTVLQLTAHGKNDEFVNTSVQEITQLTLFSLTDLSAKVGWGHLSVKNITQNKTIPSIRLTPYLTYDNIYVIANTINDFTVIDQNTRFSFTLQSSAGNSEKFLNLILFEQKLPQPTIIKNSDGTYGLGFPVKQDNSVIYLTHLEVANEEGAILPNCTWNDYNAMPDKLLGLAEGIYIVTYKDNLNPTIYSYTMQLGIDYVPETEKYRYLNDKYFVASNGTIYTGGDITVTYQSKVYSISISTNGEGQVSADTYDNTYTGIVEGFKSFVLSQPTILANSPANIEIGGQVTYTITYYDLKGTIIEKQTFVIFNKLPSINLYDNNNATITGSTSGGSMAITSSAVKINWSDLSNLPHSQTYNQTALLHTLDKTGQTLNSIEINNNRVVTNPGYYMVEICNKAFGNYRTVSFAIQEGDIPFYTVIDSKTSQTLFASSVKLDIVNEKDTTTRQTLFEQIKSYINNYAPTDIRDILLTKLGEAPTQIEQYYSINDAYLQKDASSELYEFTIRFVNGGNVLPSYNVFGSTDYVTTMYLIYGINNPIYANLIAITKVPTTSAILQNLHFYNKVPSKIELKDSFDKVLYNNDLATSAIELNWACVSNAAQKSGWYSSGNLVYLNYNYNGTNSFNNFGTINDGLTTVKISGTGKHILTFKDIAGNTHEFTANKYSYNYYTLTILDKVIFKVNNSTPLDYMVFNGDVTISLDTDYTSMYLPESVAIYATRNGSLYDKYVVGANNTSFTFTDSGRYVVTINAKAKNIAGNNDLNTVTYNFTIMERTSARLAYEFNEMLGYEVTKVYKDSIDITNRVKEYYIKKTVNTPITPEMIANYSLKQVFISPDVFGNGNYQITISVVYNELIAAKEYTFAFKISDITPIVLSKPGYGGTTKGKITLTYNPSLIYQQIGKSYLRIYTFNKDTNKFNMIGEYEINSDSLANSAMKTTELTQTNQYYVQLVTDNGNIVTSFRVNRAEPLNALSIIVIVVVSVVVVVAIIIFIKLRTKMKVK